MEIKITRKQKLLHVGNCWCDYINYWLIHGRIINDDHTQYRKFKFVINVNFTADGYDPDYLIIPCSRRSAKRQSEAEKIFEEKSRECAEAHLKHVNEKLGTDVSIEEV